MSRPTGTITHSDLSNDAILARYCAKLIELPGSGCLWWKGAISGADHGRFWIGPGRVIIAHRFAYAMAMGIDELEQAELLGHQCDNPLCQRIGPDHIVPTTYTQNRIAWQQRARTAAGGYIGPHSAHTRAIIMRDLLSLDPDAAAEHLNRLPAQYGYQPTLI